MGSCDFQLFETHKVYLASTTDADVKQSVASQLQTRDTDPCKPGSNALVSRQDSLLNVDGDYVDSGVYHLHRVCHTFI
jgi:hypothetical protein